MFRKCVPKPGQIFGGPASLHHVLHANDNNMDKSFVHGAIMLSKWLGRDRLPKGVYGLWPPDPPPGALLVVDALAGADAADDDP